MMAVAKAATSHARNLAQTCATRCLPQAVSATAAWPMCAASCSSPAAVPMNRQLTPGQRCVSSVPCGAAQSSAVSHGRGPPAGAAASAAMLAAAAALAANAFGSRPTASTAHCDAAPQGFAASAAAQDSADAGSQASAHDGAPLQGDPAPARPAALRKPFPMTSEEAAGGLTGDMARFKRWLAAVGGEVAGIDISASPAGAWAGLTLTRSHSLTADGWLSRTWHWLRRSAEDDVIIASFPAMGTLSAQTAVRDPLLGRDFECLLQDGTLDERAAIMLLLLIERRRGERSPFAPWLNLLPRDFGTALHYSEEELRELQGTTLHAATRVKKEQLPRVWAQLQPIAHDLLRRAGETADASYADFVWAFSVFWSRAQSLAPPEDAQVGHGSSDSSSADGDGSSAAPPMEALVPGLDFCNHAASPACRWELQGDRVALAAPRRWQLAPGAELAISYGHKSNEELLFHYGFVEEGNPHEVLMVACPLPPVGEWSEDMHARAALLASRGLKPQLFLPSPRPGDRELPAEAFDTLAALVMDAPQLSAALREAEAAGNGAEAPPSEHASAAQQRQQHAGLREQQGLQQKVQQLATGPADGTLHRQQEAAAAGLRMAVLTSAARLLEAKLEEMEGSEGTGPLESDVKLLAQGQMPSSVRACIVYRSGQKRIARGWLTVVNAQLQREMQALQPDVSDT